MKIAGYCGNPFMAIMLYKEVWPDPQNLVDRLEAALAESEHDCFSWKKATVGDTEEMLDYRDCSDFKLSEAMVPVTAEGFEDLGAVYKEFIEPVRECVHDDYAKRYHITLEFEEATNFVRYYEGQHFSLHPDHGFSYCATTSTIAWLNDGYEGGELIIPYMDIKFTPEAGDLMVFPSNYPYVHQSLPIIGDKPKYSAVTMYDYNDRNHQEQGPAYAGLQYAPEGLEHDGQIQSASAA